MDEDLQSRRRGVLEGALLLLVQKGNGQPPPHHMPITEHACIGPTELHREGNATTQPSELLSRLGGMLTGKEGYEDFHSDST